MSQYIIYFEQFPGLFSRWSSRQALYVPAKTEGGRFDFTLLKPGVEVAWDYDVSYDSLKRFFFPPRETLIRFDMRTCSAEPVIESAPQILFGVHPYDVRGINQLDQLMESGSIDVNYRARRDKTAIVAMDPTRLSPTAFWESVGTGQVEHGFDAYLTRISPGAFFLEIKSPKGEELFLSEGDLEKATPAEREAARVAKRKIRAQAKGKGLMFSWQETPELMAKQFDSHVWKERARTCLSCGSCVMVCPTCYCFDIQEEADDLLEKGVRYRQWDGCMLHGFSGIAGGHNFRKTPWERYRHRYMRKGKYIFDRIGELGCVGCGRCVNACTAGIANPKEVFNVLWEAGHDHE